MSATTPVTDATFQTEVLESDDPRDRRLLGALVRSVPAWSPRCSRSSPREYDGPRARSSRSTPTRTPQVTGDYGVVSIPTLNFYAGGELVKSVIGARPKSIIAEEIEARARRASDRPAPTSTGRPVARTAARGSRLAGDGARSIAGAPCDTRGMTAQPVPDARDVGPPHVLRRRHRHAPRPVARRRTPSAPHGMRASEIRALFAVANRPEVVSLAGGMPYLDGLPLDVLADLAQRVVATRGLTALQYGSGQGDETLREQILEVMALEGIDAHPDDVVVTTGLAAGARPGDPHLHRPGRRRRRRGALATSARSACSGRTRPTSCTCRSTRDGLDPRGARGDPDRARAPRAAASSSSTPCPTSTTPPASRCPLERRPQILEIAARHGVLVLEDNPYGLLGFDGDPLPAHALARRRGRHLPRLVLQDVRPRATASAGSSRRTPSARSSSWPASPRSSARRTPRSSRSRPTWRPATGRARSSRSASMYRERRDAMIGALAEHLPDATWTVPDGGFYTWVKPARRARRQGRCCRAPSPRASPTSPGPPSTPTAPAPTTCGCRSATRPPSASARACGGSPGVVAGERELVELFGTDRGRPATRDVQQPGPDVA